VGVFALGFQLTDLFRQAVALVLQFFGANLAGLALNLQRLEGLDVQKRLRAFAAVESRDGGR
jgi:hypothetical protein